MAKLPTSIRLKPETLAYVDEQADKRGWSRSSFIAWLVDQFRVKNVKRRLSGESRPDHDDD